MPEDKIKKEVSIIDEEDKIAAMQVDVLPDYAVTKEDMHAYGYTWDGMLPVTGITAKALARIGVTIYELRENDTEGMVDDPDVFGKGQAVRCGKARMEHLYAVGQWARLYGSASRNREIGAHFA